MSLAYIILGIIFLLFLVIVYVVSGIKAILDRRAIKARLAAKTGSGANPSTFSRRVKKCSIMVYHDTLREHQLKDISNRRASSPVDVASAVLRGECIPADPIFIAPIKIDSTLCTIEEQFPVSDFGTLPASRALASDLDAKHHYSSSFSGSHSSTAVGHSPRSQQRDSLHPQMGEGYLSLVSEVKAFLNSASSVDSTCFPLAVKVPTSDMNTYQ